MRKNSIRKLIHGILDLLPLFVIPIFAININQKSVEPISITRYEHKISKKYETNEVNSSSDLIKGNIYKFTFDYSTFTGNANFLSVYGIYSVNNTIQKIVGSDQTITCTYLVANDLILTNQGGYQVSFYNVSQLPYLYVVYDQILNSNVTYENFSISDFTDDVYGYDQMVVYDNTDIGSQFLYSLYISTDKYFNMNNVFNLNSVYQWFEMNIFNGTAPLSIYIVWNIIIYELVMDLLMLLYALFMFFIDMCQKLIDKPLNSIK